MRIKAIQIKLHAISSRNSIATSKIWFSICHKCMNYCEKIKKWIVNDVMLTHDKIFKMFGIKLIRENVKNQWLIWIVNFICNKARRAQFYFVFEWIKILYIYCITHPRICSLRAQFKVHVIMRSIRSGMTR